MLSLFLRACVETVTLGVGDPMFVERVAVRQFGHDERRVRDDARFWSEIYIAHLDDGIVTSLNALDALLPADEPAVAAGGPVYRWPESHSVACGSLAPTV
jgi:hypothetical protein